MSAAPAGTAFDGQGMWIWYVSQSDGGNLASIVAQAHAAQSRARCSSRAQTAPATTGASSARRWWRSCTRADCSVCAWQYVYGTNPAGEAALGAKAVAAGADCLVIDAESEYEGKYGAAQTYIADLRAKIGAAYPLGLASFPYVYYHTAFPYSVFLGPEGAQFNAPQMYWKAIGNSVDTAYADTYILKPHLRPRRSSRSVRPTNLPRAANCCASARRHPCTARPASPGGTSRRPRRPAGRRWAPPWRRSPRSRPTGLVGTIPGQQRRPGAVDAGAPGQRHPDAGDDRHLRRGHQGQPGAVPERPRHRRPAATPKRPPGRRCWPSRPSQ